VKKIWTFGLLLSLSTMTAAKEFHFAGQDYPPFNWEENGQVTGGMVDVMRKVCNELKHKCHFTIVPLARAMKMLEEGNIDGVLSLIPNPERQVYAYFSPAIIVTDMSYLGVKGASKVSTIKELAGWNIGAVRSSSSLKMAKKHNAEVKTLIINEEVDNETMVKKLGGGRYGKQGAIIGAEGVLGYLAKKNNIEIEPVLKLEPQEFMVAYSKKKISENELETLKTTVEKLKKDGTLKSILDKYGLRTN